MHAVQVHSRATSAVKILPAVAGGLVIAAATSLPALCPFRLWSGHACPLCGMTRAARSLASGDVATAVQFHPLVILLAVEAAILAAVYARTRSHPPALRWRYGLLDFVVAGS